MTDFDMEMKADQEEFVKTNPFLGVVGAVVGALIGAALWVILYQFGVIAAIAGIAIVYLACKGYQMLSKSYSMGGVIISVIISIIVLTAAHFLSWGLDIYNVFIVEYDISLWDAILAVPDIAFTEDFIVDFIKEFMMGFVLICVGSAPFFRKAAKSKAKIEE